MKTNDLKPVANLLQKKKKIQLPCYNYSPKREPEERKYACTAKNHEFQLDMEMSALNEKVARFWITYCEIFFWMFLDIGGL